ncbi:MAG: dihydrofolate reductase [Chitinophagaceae bacterium]
MQIILIAAVSENNVIAKDGEMPWHLSSDLKYFKNQTWGLPVFMGRKTMDAFGKGKALPGRLNIVLTHNPDYNADGVVTVASFKDAQFVAKEKDYNVLMVIGGGQIYAQTIDKAYKLLITRVHKTIEDGDTLFPEIDPKKWKLTSSQDFPADEKNTDAYSFQVWERK